MSRAHELCLAALAAGKTRQQIALETGYSRTAISLYLSGQYTADPGQIEAAICKAYDRHDCPHTRDVITPDVCRRKALAAEPFGGSERRRWWLCCQSCPHKPEVKS